MRAPRALLLIASLAAADPARAGGWETVHRYVHPTGRCGGRQELLASYYWSGTRTANGERFDPDGLTAASRHHAFGTILTIENPRNGRACRIRVNDRGPWGIAYEKGARLDLARGAARCLGMTQTSYVCASR